MGFVFIFVKCINMIRYEKKKGIKEVLQEVGGAR